MSISAWPSIAPTRPRSACSRASRTSAGRRNALKRTARMAIINSPPTNSASVNCYPSSRTMMIPSSMTRFVDANSKAMAAVKLAPLRKIERASATAAYEHEDDAAPRQAAIISVRDESSGRSRLISDFETTAWTIADNPKPRTSAHRISQDIAVTENDKGGPMNGSPLRPEAEVAVVDVREHRMAPWHRLAEGRAGWQRHVDELRRDRQALDRPREPPAGRLTGDDQNLRSPVQHWLRQAIRLQVAILRP